MSLLRPGQQPNTAGLKRSLPVVLLCFLGSQQPNTAGLKPMYLIVKNSIKSGFSSAASPLNRRRSPVVQNSQRIDDAACFLQLSAIFGILRAKLGSLFCRFLVDRRRFNPAVLPYSTLERAMLTASAAFLLLRYLSYQTLQCFSSCKLSDGSVEALEAGAVNHRTAGHCRQAEVTLAGRNFTPIRRCALC